MKPIPFHTTLGDKVLAVVIILSAGGLFYALPDLIITGGNTIEVFVDNEPFGAYTIDRDRELRVPGPLGPTIIGVNKGRVRIIESPCPGKHCIRMGEVGREGGTLICVPNRVVVRVVEESENELDAVSR
jgi:hypothetical protein